MSVFDDIQNALQDATHGTAQERGGGTSNNYAWLQSARDRQMQAQYDYSNRANPYLDNLQQESAIRSYDLMNRSVLEGEQRAANIDAAARAYGGALSQTGQQYGSALATAGNNAANNLYSQADVAQQYGAGQGANLSAYGGQQAAGVQNLGQQAAGQILTAGNNAANNLYSAGNVAQAYGASAAQREAPELNFGQTNRLLTQGANAASQLAGLEQQQGPSAAQAQLRSGLNEAQASNLAMARSGRGWGGSAQALSQAQNANAAAGQQAANQSAMLRAQEDAAWRARQGQNLQAAGSLRQGLAQQAMAQQGLGAQTALQSQAQNDAALQGMYGLGTNAMAQGSQLAVGAAGQAGQLGVNAQLGGAQLGADAMRSGADLGMQGYGMQQSGYNLGSNASMAGIQGGGSLALGGLQAGAGAELQGMQAAGAHQLAGYGQGAQISNAGMGLGLAAEQQRGTIAGSQQQIEQQYVQNALQQQANAQGVAIQNAQSQNTMAGAGIAAGGMLLAALSDRDAKKNIEPANGRVLLPSSGQVAASRGANDASAAARARAIALNNQPTFLQNLGTSLGGAMQGFGGQLMSDEREKESLQAVEHTPMYSFDYKDPDAMGAEPGRQFGVMAQDLERTPAGRSVVTRTPEGKRMVDTSRLTMVNTGALNALQRHVDELDQMVRARRKAA